MKMKLMMVVAAVAVALGAWADTETVGGYTWTYRINGDTAEITKVVHSAGITPEPDDAVTIPSTLGGYSVVSFGNEAFYDCRGVITSVTIPDSVTSIGESVFSDSWGLKSVIIPNSVTNIGNGAFRNCGLTHVTIPDSVASIGKYAFSDCSGLTNVTIGTRVTNIGECAFWKCIGLVNVTIPNSVTNIGYMAFSGCSGLTSVTIGNGVTSLGTGAFSGCIGLTSVTIPDGVTVISAFSGCRGLTSVTIPDSVTDIGGFDGCSGLKSITLPDNLASIGHSAFSGCSGLTSVTIPNNVTSIGNCAFSGCSGLTSVTIPNSMTSIGNYAFSNCSGITNVTIGINVTSIGVEAFQGCSGLMAITVDSGNASYTSINGLLLSVSGKRLIQGVNGDVTIPSGVTSIEERAFYGCSGLTSVTISDSVKHIFLKAFYGCSGLTSITIPSSVTNIGTSAFAHCNGISNVVIKASGLQIGYEAFAYLPNLMTVEFYGNVSGVYYGSSGNKDGYVFRDSPLSATGSYPKEYGTFWESMVDSDGKWQGLTMRESNSGDDSGSGGSGSGSDGGSGGASGGGSGSGTGSDSEDVQGEWYASLSDKREATSVSVGGETWNTSKQLPYRFSCGAVLTSTVGGKRLDLNNVTVSKNGIYADGDLAILLTGDNYVSGPIYHGTKSGSYMIFGLGTLTVRNGDLRPAIEGTDVSICAGAAVTIYQEDDFGAAISASKTSINMSMLTIHSIDTEGKGISSREVNILCSLVAVNCRTIGIADYGGTVVIDGSVVNICMDGNYASNYFKTFSCTHSYFSFVNNTGSALNADEVWFENSLAKLYSNSSYALNAGNITFGEGDYYVVSGRKSEYGSALDASTILIDGGDVQVCSPFDQYAVAVNVTDFQMDAGSFEIVDKVDIRPFLEYDAAAATVYTGVLAVGGADVASFMSSFYSDVILDAISNGKLNDVSGTADYGIKCSTYTQTGGTVWMPSSVRGVHSYQTPVVNGGSYNNSFYGYSWDYESGTYAMVNPVGTAGGEEEELACFSYQIAGAKKRDKVSQSWTGVLPSYYGTGSLYADEEGILYFWLPKDWSLSDEGSDNDDPVSPVPEDAVTVTPTPDPVTPGYEVLKEKDITAPYEAPKAVTLQGVVYDGGGAVVGVVELKLGKVNAKKKTSKVSGSFTGLDGKKITIKGVNVAGIDGTAPVTVSLDVKGHGTMTVTIGGTQFAGTLGSWHVQSGTVGGNWSKAGAKVYVDVGGGRGATALPAGTIKGLLPDGEPVAPKSGKWSFAKAASVKWVKPKKGAVRPENYDEESGKGLIVDASKGTNLSGMKLTYTPKTGVFKGSFKIYALEGAGKSTKLKKYTVKVTGVVVDGVGHGEATCKKPAAGPWAVTVE